MNSEKERKIKRGLRRGLLAAGLGIGYLFVQEYRSRNQIEQEPAGRYEFVIREPEAQQDNLDRGLGDHLSVSVSISGGSIELIEYYSNSNGVEEHRTTFK